MSLRNRRLLEKTLATMPLSGSLAANTAVEVKATSACQRAEKDSRRMAGVRIQYTAGG
jgi:hypothetical protein